MILRYPARVLGLNNSSVGNFGHLFSHLVSSLLFQEDERPVNSLFMVIEFKGAKKGKKSRAHESPRDDGRSSLRGTDDGKNFSANTAGILYSLEKHKRVPSLLYRLSPL